VTQLGLLEWSPPVLPMIPSVQSEQMARVQGRIAETILAWLEYRALVAPVFHASDLCQYVVEQCGGSPESAMRVLRAMRRSGQVDVELLSRSESKYAVRAGRAAGGSREPALP
jgi:hypothetical protein